MHAHSNAEWVSDVDERTGQTRVVSVATSRQARRQRDESAYEYSNASGA